MKDADIVKLIPNGFLGNYMKLTENTESPARFHFLVGLTILGTAMGRAVYMNMGMFEIYPNIYSLIVAPTGKCRKSTAIQIGMKILRQAELENIKTIGPQITPEALIKVAKRERPTYDAAQGKVVPVHPDSVNLIYVPELAVFLDKRDYNAGMVPLLTDLFDCPDEWSSTTIGRGEQRLRNVFVSTLFASTQSWLRNLLPKSAFAGGFMGRLFISVADNTERCFPTPLPINQGLLAECIMGLQKINQLKGEYIWTNKTQTWFSAWYMTNKKRLDDSTDERECAYLERKQVQLIKVAMILAANDGRVDLKQEDFERALAIIDMYEHEAFLFFMRLSNSDSPDQEIFDSLLEFMGTKKNIATHREIMSFMAQRGVIKSKAADILSILIDGNLFQGRTHGTRKIYRYVPRGGEEK